nr:MFS transporter [Sphingomonas sp. Y57]
MSSVVLPATAAPAGGRALFAAVYASVVSEYSLLVMPFIVGAMIDSYGASEQLAGRIVSLQLFGMAISAVGASVLMRRIDRLHAMVAMTAIVVLSNILCALMVPLPVMIAARFATGIGEGALMAIAGAVAAATPDPRRAFSAIGFAVALAAAAALVATPWLVGIAGRAGTFWFLAGFSALSLPFLGWAAPLRRVSASEPVAGTAAIPATLSRNPLLALLAFGLFWAGAAGLWVYAERIGLSHGLSLGQIGFFLGLGQLAGIPGPLCVGWLARRFALPPLFTVAILFNLFAGLAFVFVPNGWVYCLGAALLSFWAMFLTPCFRTLMALLDRSGTVVAASVAAFTIGYGAAPLLITFFLDGRSGFAAVALICSLLYFASAVCVLPPAMRIGRADVQG